MASPSSSSVSRLVPLLAPQLPHRPIDLPGFGESPPLPGGGFDRGAVCERVEAVVTSSARAAGDARSLARAAWRCACGRSPGALPGARPDRPAGLIGERSGAPILAPSALHALAGLAVIATPLIARAGTARARLRAVVGDRHP